jgi:cohesin loading factor subunit SCC2
LTEVVLHLEPLERFTSLIEDIFEAEDALDPSSTELDSDFFSPLSSAASPRLSRNTISKLVKRIQKVSNFSQSRRKKSFVSGKSPMSHSVDGKGGMGQVDTTILTRVLRILDRSIKLAVDADISSIFPRQSAGTRNEGSDVTASPSKQKKPVNLESEELSALPTDKLDALRQTLDAFAESLHAAEAVIGLLASDHLPKQVRCCANEDTPQFIGYIQMYSEDLISACISVLKDALSSLIYPLMEALTPSALVQTHYARSFLLAVLDDRNGEIKRSLELIHTSISAIIPLLTSLLNSVNQIITMSESIIIQMVYISIGPFFVPDAANDEGKGNKKKKLVGNIIDDAIAEDVFPSSSPLKGLRLNALSLLRTVCWILGRVSILPNHCHL